MKTLLTLIAATALCSCSITQDVVPLPPDVVVGKIYMQDNPNVHMEGFQPELRRQIEENGVEVHVYDSQPPEGARFTLEFTANWTWDMAMYLSYFRADVFDNGRSIGSMEYDARSGGANMGKFGNTASKIRPLVYELFGNEPPTEVDVEG